jgi:hypothetical protein
MQTYLHIGYPKNASTSLETFLFPNIENSYYMGKRYCGKYSFAGNDVEEVVENITKQDSIYFDLERSKKILYDDITANIGNNQHVIISSEAFTSNVVDRGVIASRLYNIFPKAKILIIIREQINSLLSMYAYLVSQKGGGANLSYGKPSVTSFSKWIEDQENFEYRSYIGTLKYFLLVKYYRNLFGSDNVTVLIYEELLNNPEIFASKLAAYLEVECDKNFLNALLKRTNQSVYGIKLLYAKFRNTPLYRLSGIKYIPISKIARLLGIGKEVKKNAAKEISEEVRSKLLMMYKDDNQKLQSELQIDLSLFNYII